MIKTGISKSVYLQLIVKNQNQLSGRITCLIVEDSVGLGRTSAMQCFLLELVSAKAQGSGEGKECEYLCRGGCTTMFHGQMLNI